MQVFKGFTADFMSHGIFHIELNSPEQLNVLSHDTLQSLSDVFIEVQQNSQIKSVLLTSLGKVFCAGANIKELANLNGVSGLKFAEFGQKVLLQLETLGKPSLAAVQGAALGGGCELAMACTLRIAAETAFFAQPEIKLGIIPGFGGTQRLARLIGKGRALKYCLTGERISAADALTWGLVTDVVPVAELKTAAINFLTQISQLSDIAVRALLKTINDGFDLNLEDGLSMETLYFSHCAAAQDKNEGVSAFLEKRNPIFLGE